MKSINPKFKHIFIAIAFTSLFVCQISYADESSSAFNEDALVNDNLLSIQRGQGMSQSAMSIATVNHNVINIGSGASLTNGDNLIADGAFANSSGIATVIQNSGNNVVIQDSTIVNVTFQ